MQKYGQKSCFWPQKGPFLDPKKGPKVKKIDFSIKLHFLHILAKFKQKIAKKSKNMAKNGVFGQKSIFLLKLHFLAKFKQKIPPKKNMAEKAVFGPKKAIFGPEKRTKMTKIVFSLKLHFLHFLSKFR